MSTPIVLKQENWPESDIALWSRLFETGDWFDGTGPLAHLRDGSQTKYAQGYGQWLSFLTRKMPDTLTAPPLDRVTLENVRAFIEECDERLNYRSVSNQISDLLAVVSAADASRDWSWLKRAAYRLLARAHTGSLPPPINLTAKDVFRWGLGRMREVAEGEYNNEKMQAIHFRQALMIGFLIANPIRRRTLLLMEFGKHLIDEGDWYRLKFEADDMKDKRARAFPLAKKLVDPMRLYLDRFRPILLQGKQTESLWINQYGNPITPDGLSRELPKVTERHLGVALRPHAFRHIVATSIAEVDPANVNIIKDVLGHATLTMSERHYNRSRGVDSCNELQSIVEDIQNSVPIMGRANRNDFDGRP